MHTDKLDELVKEYGYCMYHDSEGCNGPANRAGGTMCPKHYSWHYHWGKKATPEQVDRFYEQNEHRLMRLRNHASPQVIKKGPIKIEGKFFKLEYQPGYIAETSKHSKRRKKKTFLRKAA